MTYGGSYVEYVENTGREAPSVHSGTPASRRLAGERLAPGAARRRLASRRDAGVPSTRHEPMTYGGSYVEYVGNTGREAPGVHA